MMTDLSVSQSYLLCALNDNGKLPALSAEIPVCLLAGALLDLMMAGCVTVGSDQKLAAAHKPGEEQRHLCSLYDFIESKPMKAENLASEYTFTFSDKRLKTLIHDVGQSLVSLDCAASPESRRPGAAARFVPDGEHVDHVIQRIRAELLEDGAVSEAAVALVSLMDQSNMLKRYFSSYEKDRLKARLREIQRTDSYRLVKEMAGYVDAMLVVIAASGAH